MPSLSVACALTALAVAPALARPPVRPVVVNNSTGLLSTYDYVIVGGGASGLTVANRLTENSATTVLVIEAGDFDQGEDFITIPALAGGAVGTKYDWNTSYAATADVNDRAVSIPQGKVVGGGTVLNRMLMHRGSAFDYDRWEALGNEGWGFSDLLPFFKKSENFSAPNADIEAKYDIGVDSDVHGNQGPIEASYSPYFLPSTQNFVAGAQELNIKIPFDAQNGEAQGALWITHAQGKTTVARDSARNGYYDSVKPRTNYHFLPNTLATKLLLKGTTATGVEFAASTNATRQTVSARKEVILAAGPLFTPKLLQLSGIGPRALLTKYSIPTIVDLPVGLNLHDHVMVPLAHTISNLPITASALQQNASLAAAARAEYEANKTGPYSTATGDLLFFLPTLNYTNATDALAAKAKAANATTYLDTDTPLSYKKGYAKQRAQLMQTLTTPDAATLELIPADGTVLVGLMHPFSRGSVKIQSTDPFELPVADAAFLRDPVDVAVLVEGLKFARKLFATQALAELEPVEVSPGANVTSDAALEQAVRQGATTIYHPVGSCHMGKRGEGAVVDDELRVYGTKGLRVVDASVMPLVPGAHIMATVYGVAEKAADLIMRG